MTLKNASIMRQSHLLSHVSFPLHTAVCENPIPPQRPSHTNYRSNEAFGKQVGEKSGRRFDFLGILQSLSSGHHYVLVQGLLCKAGKVETG